MPSLVTSKSWQLTWLCLTAGCDDWHASQSPACSAPHHKPRLCLAGTLWLLQPQMTSAVYHVMNASKSLAFKKKKKKKKQAVGLWLSNSLFRNNFSDEKMCCGFDVTTKQEWLQRKTGPECVFSAGSPSTKVGWWRHRGSDSDHERRKQHWL